LSLGGVRPDLCLIAIFLVGFLEGELDGVMMGLALGFVQDLFSAGGLGLNLITKGSIGLVVGLIGRHLANTTHLTIFALLLGASLFSGLGLVLWAWAGEGLTDALMLVQSILLPQALYDAGIGTTVYWLLAGRRPANQGLGEDRMSFGK
jgi:rod shape-determining protein MreD